MSDKYSLRLCVTNTGHSAGYDLPVPLGSEIILDQKKGESFSSSGRKMMHQALDNWITSIHQNPEQYGSHMRAAFELEYRGDSEDWMTMEEKVSITAKETIRMRLAEIMKIANNK